MNTPAQHPADAPRLELLPAVDVVDGRAVQLQQGVAGSGWEFGDPLEAALAWQEAGAQWLHLVDLDAAFGRGSNHELLARIVGGLDLCVEMSGGIRDSATLERALATGCRRVNIGTAALENPEWTAAAIAEHGDRVAIGLDVRGTTLAARGWTRDGGDLWETLARLDAEGGRIDLAPPIFHPGGDVGYPVFTEFGADLPDLVRAAGFEVEVFFGPVGEDDIAQVYVARKPPGNFTRVNSGP